MQVDLNGHAALVAGKPGTVASAVAAELTANGAFVVARSPALPAEAREEIDAVVADRGRLDVLVLLPDGDATPECTGTALAFVRSHAEAAAPALSAAGGRIVVVGSVLGLVPARAAAEASAEAAALFALVKTLAMQLGPAAVRINAVAVGALAESAGEVRPRAGTGPHFLSHIPLGRPGTPEGLARAVLFLADPENSYINGHVLAFDGGWSAGYARDF